MKGSRGRTFAVDVILLLDGVRALQEVEYRRHPGFRRLRTKPFDERRMSPMTPPNTNELALVNRSSDTKSTDSRVRCEELSAPGVQRPMFHFDPDFDGHFALICSTFLISL